MLNYCTVVNPLRLIDIRSVLFGVPQGDSQWCGSTNVMLITAEGQLVELSFPQRLLLHSGRMPVCSSTVIDGSNYAMYVHIYVDVVSVFVLLYNR